MKVSLQYDYEGNVPAEQQRPEAARPAYEWFSANTDSSGEAKLSIEETMLDRSIGSTPPAWRDQVTAKSYLVRLGKEGSSEECALVIHPGQSIQTPSYTLRVLEIGKPRYVETGP